jgi:predicted MPP superfamily phosphohydrolase
MVKRISLDFASHCADLLARLECPHKYAVMGNHDAMVGSEAVTDALTPRGISVLSNTAIPIERDGARIWLAGVSDILEGNPDIDATVPRGRSRATEPLILMAHEPDYADFIGAYGVDLMLSGHTHGGQVRIPFMPLFNLPPLGAMQLFVTRGIGTVGVPFRLRCPPEITVITLI